MARTLGNLGIAHRMLVAMLSRVRSWRSRRWKRRWRAKRGVKQSTCGGEAGWYQEEEGGIRRTCESELSKLHDKSEKVNGTLPRRRTRQHGDFNKVIFPTRNRACNVGERRPCFLSNPVKVDDVASTQLGTARVALPRQGTWRKWS